MTEYRIEAADWETDKAGLIRLRSEVFIKEQGVPAELELDELDAHCVHVKAVDANANIIGTARLLASGYIGRMCVYTDYRRCGVGSGMLGALIEIARQRGDTQLMLNAQLSALHFYQRFGFVADSEIFVEAGIDHQHMTLNLEI